jgi:hypothetical protein
MYELGLCTPDNVIDGFPQCIRTAAAYIAHNGDCYTETLVTTTRTPHTTHTLTVVHNGTLFTLPLHTDLTPIARIMLPGQIKAIIDYHTNDETPHKTSCAHITHPQQKIGIDITHITHIEQSTSPTQAAHILTALIHQLAPQPPITHQTNKQTNN